MTHCAQQLDKEHRRLKNQEQWLKIQYSSQEEDYELLMKQILYYRKQNKTIKEQHGNLKDSIETYKKEEEETDRMLASKLDNKKVHMPTIMKPTKRVADAL